MKGSYITVAIFDERIEISNPGGLPFGFTIEKALAGSSRIRNRVIAKVFYHLKWIEQWGSGLRRIINACAKHGLAEPKFEELLNEFRVTLYAAKNKTQLLIKPWQQKLVTKLKKEKQLSTKQIAALWEVSTRTARLRLIQLIDAGIIYHTGSSAQDPYGAYILRLTKVDLNYALQY